MKKYKLGLDVGGTKIQVGLVDTNNKIIRSEQVAIHRKTKKEALESIIKSIKPLFSTQASSIGVGITGHVNPTTGIVAGSVNLPKDWKDVQLKKILEKKFKVSVTIDNDANCSALAEAIVGKGKKYNAIMNITIGTGIGIGIVMNKQLFRGGQNATEFGHTIINAGFSFEKLVSGPSLVRNFRKKTGQTKTSYEIVTAANKGNRTAQSVIRVMSRWLAVGLNNAMLSYSPEIIIIGGGLASVPSLVRPAIQDAKKMLLYRRLSKTIITPSSLGYNAGVIGAVLITNSKKK